MGTSLNDISNLLCKIYLLKKGLFGFSVSVIQITVTPSLTIVELKSNTFCDKFPQKKGDKLDLNLLKVWVKTNNYKISISTSLKHLKRQISLELYEILNSDFDFKKQTFRKLLNQVKTKIINWFKT